MSYNSYPERFDVDDSRLSTLVLYAAIGMDRHRRGNADSKDYKSITRLANLVSEFVQTRETNSPLTEVALARVLYSEEGIKGKTLDDLYSQSLFFAKDLSTFREISEEKQSGVYEVCLKLHKGFLPRTTGYRRRLAA